MDNPSEVSHVYTAAQTCASSLQVDAADDSKLVLQRCDCNGEGIDAAEQLGAPKGNTPLMAPAKNGTQGTADVHSCGREPAAEEVTNLHATTPRKI